MWKQAPRSCPRRRDGVKTLPKENSRKPATTSQPQDPSPDLSQLVPGGKPWYPPGGLATARVPAGAHVGMPALAHHTADRRLTLLHSIQCCVEDQNVEAGAAFLSTTP